jgi:hypothetical protein
MHIPRWCLEEPSDHLGQPAEGIKWEVRGANRAFIQFLLADEMIHGEGALIGQYEGNTLLIAQLFIHELEQWNPPPTSVERLRRRYQAWAHKRAMKKSAKPPAEGREQSGGG